MSTQFDFGSVVHHIEHGYRGVVVDVHDRYLGTDEWYDRAPMERSSKEQTWYEVLVDGKPVRAYVAADQLEADYSFVPIANPLVRVFFNRFDGRHYSVSGQEN